MLETQGWDDEQWAAERQRYLDLILESPAQRKVAVAGPGTGKTHTFKEVLKRKDGPRLAITFINNLVRDLEKGLAGLADVYSFYSFCKKLLYSQELPGITKSADYYPPIKHIFAADVSLMESVRCSWKDIDQALHNRDDSRSLISFLHRSGNYYNAVGYTDSVYRVLSHLEVNDAEVPRFSQVVVDEYQDFSLMEVAFINVLGRFSPMFVVGDDDQALYTFKHASAIFLRNLAETSEWARFELPFCTRCTEVLVAAVHEVVVKARARDLLSDRLAKEYVCYLPAKRDESSRYPSITYAACSVERNDYPYMAKYIHQKIWEIPTSEIEESHAEKFHTVLVTGPVPFPERLFNHLSKYFENIEFKATDPLEPQLIDGYQRLRLHGDSLLGWRIVLYCDPLSNAKDALGSAIGANKPLRDLLPPDYVGRHLENADIVRRLLAGEGVSQEEVVRIETALNMPFLTLKELLRLDSSEEEQPAPDESKEKDESETPARDKHEPRIIVTTLVGAKGLQAGHVFLAGMNDRHFPRRNAHPTEEELCSLLVALTRARKKCYVLSCGSFGRRRLRPSIFLDWLGPFLEKENVDAAYFRAHSKV